MSHQDRRSFLRTLGQAAGASAALASFPPAIQRALAIPANQRTGTLQDVEHIVVLTQENRAFDHYFGTLAGVRGFADPFPIPVMDRVGTFTRKSVFVQPVGGAAAVPGRPGWGSTRTAIAPFHLNTQQNFNVMRVSGTPHSWPDAQAAWDEGRMNNWPAAKQNHSLGHYKESDLPFQFALANAFTLCDHYHCATQTGTNTNRLFLWTGGNDPLALGGGPSTDNSHDSFNANPATDYTWTTYPERLQAAGISWQVYQNMADNFTDNPLAGFRPFRDAFYQRAGYSAELRDRGVTTRNLDKLKEDVLADKLPQVSWIVATAEGSEHPGPSSPASGADYTARVLDALTSNPAVWSKTVLFINFDENDGFFDHVPPPAAPAYDNGVLAGKSTVSTAGEYHTDKNPYGPGPRVPMYIVSPWSRGGWVNSQAFDHTSVLRFLELRFNVKEPNISAYRRAVLGDLTSAFNFVNPNNETLPTLPSRDKATADSIRNAQQAKAQVPVPSVAAQQLPVQATGTRPSRALPYELHVSAREDATNRALRLIFSNTGTAAAVFHVYDRLHLDRVPRRYAVEPGKMLDDAWDVYTADKGKYDLWVLGPNGFHRAFSGDVSAVSAAGSSAPEIRVCYDLANAEVYVTMMNTGTTGCTFTVKPNAYRTDGPWTFDIPAGKQLDQHWPIARQGNWYDFTVTVPQGGFTRRFAGRMETGKDSVSDPAMGT